MILPIEELLKMPPDELQSYLGTLADDQRQEVENRISNARSVPALPGGDITKSRIESLTGLRDALSVAPKATPSLDQNVDEGVSFKESTRMLGDRLTTLAGIAGTVTDVANMSDPSRTDVKTGAIAGALTGAAGGAALGPIGAVGGALFGAITGAIKSGSQREAYETEEQRRLDNLLTGLRRPVMQEKGGLATDPTAPEIAAQNEEGEILLLPDGRLVDSMATKKHKEMDTDDVTDIQPNPTFVFSNSKKRLINLSKIKDDIFTITRGNYSEDGNTPMETIRMGDVYGDSGEATPAEIAKSIRKKTPIIEKPVEDMERRTNSENLRRRAELLRPIMLMQEGAYTKFEFKNPPKFEEGGCPPGYLLNDEGDCVPMISAKDLAQMSPEAATNYALQLPADQQDRAIGRTIDYLLDPSLQHGNLPAKLPTRTPSVTYNGSVSDILDRRDRKVSPVSMLAPRELKPITGLDLPLISKGPATTTPVTPTGGTSTVSTDPLFGTIRDKLAKDEEQVETDYNEAAARASQGYRSKRLRNLGVLATKLTAIGAQNPNVTPDIQGTEFIDGMFPRVTESDIQGQVNPLRNSQNRVLEAINSSGISGSQVGSAIASTQANLLDTEGRIRSSAEATNRSQNARRYEALRNVVTTNRSKQVSAENATRSGRNRLVSAIGTAGAEFITAQGGLENAIETRMNQLEQWRQQSKSRISESEFETLMREEEVKLRKAWFDQDKAFITKEVDRLIQNFKK